MANLELLSRRLRAQTGGPVEGAEELVGDAREGAERIRRVMKLVQRIARRATAPEAD
jgi:hypothetical protein